ncbi:ABC transporter ATP-binding protein [Lichenihabitans psoromatis]|uniref:ABC transporter ATP-binding protein n=1 Tax=Lichenihabitans psoromatis TaxID=2528642 RepID=UPI0010384C87|nr:ABC transporter ATP-binding protein [Lichenihabitans psoromatis]
MAEVRDVVTSPLIGVEHLSVSFRVSGGLALAVQDVSFAVREGESFGIVGESGSGKSTVLRAIAGLVAPTRGRLTLDGTVLEKRRSLAQRRAMQVVFQDPYGSLHPRQTVDRILREPLAIHRIAEPDAVIRATMLAVDLDPAYRFRFPHQLSGGQRQRVAIARALMLQPRILLLDEPTSALDVSVQAEVLNLLARLRAGRTLTSILVSHDLAVVAHLCDRVAIMRRGRIVEVVGVDALRSGEVREDYTRDLLAASRGFRRRTTDVVGGS